MNVFINKKGSVSCMTIILLPLWSPDPGGPFRYLVCMILTYRKFFRSAWSSKVDQNSTYGQILGPSPTDQKLFLKSQQVTSNPKSERSKLHMTMVRVCFSFYMIRAFDWYSKSDENYLCFCSFWEPHWSRFRLRIFFRATTCIIYVFRTSLWSHSFATK